MNKFEEQRAEETAAIDRERRAFERRLSALTAITGQFFPKGNGQPSQSDMDELDNAEAEWQEAHAEIERISNEIKTGQRR